jgi:serine/threonine-protein kinase
MAKQREDRYQSTAEVAAMLGAHAPTLGAEPQSLRPTPGWHPPEPDADTKSGEKTVAVLPFRNAGAPDDEYVAEGLTEDLIDTLSMTPGLRVRPLSSVMAYRERTGDPREVGNALGVEVVVDGSIRRMGETLRIAARLISVRDGFQLWAKRFDRSRSELLVVSDEAAHAIAEALTVGVVSPVRAAPSDSQAIDLYLRGRREHRKVWSKPTRRAAELFAQAHARAPGDTTLLAAHAYARARVWYFEGGVEQGRIARELAERAMVEAPERGESCMALAAVRFIEQDFEAAAPLLKRALDRSPQLAEAHELLGEILLEVSDPEEAIKSFRTALAIDPELRSRFHIARANAMLGRWSEAEALLSMPAEDEQSQTIKLSMAHRLALWSDAFKDYAAALDLPAAAEDPLPVTYATWCRETLRTGKLSDAARAFMDEQVSQPDPAPRFGAFKHQLAAELLAFVGAVEPALVHVESALRTGFWDKNWLELCPLLARARQEMAFAELHGRVAERAQRVKGALR